MSGIAFVLGVVISTGSLAWGYASMGLETVPRWMIAFGVVWLFAYWRRWNWFSALALFLSMLFAIAGLWLQFPIGWMFASAIFALAAWDMAELRTKLNFLSPREDAKGFERRRVARVSLLMLVGLLVASIFILWWRQWNLEWGYFLLSVTLLGLTQVIAWFGK
ncbi:MAG: hypothetical protein IH588_00010 [Anaerolineales bacterium]|nr:hypothetical protein [Anaerolineales bacterium]